MSPGDYKLLSEQISFTWVCDMCNLPNFTDSFFENSSILTDNSFSILSGDQSSDDEDEQAPQVRLSNVSLGTNQQMRIAIMNCCSLRSIRKQAELHLFVSECKPDIILGTESHLDKDISDGEAFPQEYHIHRKDRNKYGGGVFIAVSKQLNSCECTELNNSSESIWVKIQCKNQPWLFVGAHYRPPNGDIQPVIELTSTLTKITQEHPASNIILGGDFNLPSIDWEQASVKDKPQYGNNLNTAFMDMLNTLGLSQMVSIPTRLSNTLDLLITNNPDMVKNVDTRPGISDHEAVTANIHLNAQRNKKKPRSVWKFGKGNIEGLVQDLQQFQQSFLRTNYFMRTVEENWTLFKEAVQEALKKNIPSKVIRGNNDLPWVKNNRNVQRMRRRRQRAYNRQRKTKQDVHRKRYQVLRNQVKQVIHKAHEDYINDILNLENQQKAPRKFWSYIRARGKDDVGVAPLMTDDGLVTTGEEKAKVLAKQYESVFTEEDLSNMPNKGRSTVPDMPEIRFRTAGIEKLLLNLDVNKASGPDQVPVRVLKSAAAVIAPVLQIIMTQSYQTATLPADWKTANVTAIFKKGDKATPANYRPVSLTSVVCKLMEHIVFKAVMDHSDQNSILTMRQHGFRPKFSCETQLISTVEDIAHSVDKGSQVDALVLDFSKAFDKVPHQRLLSKLNFYGIRNTTASWIEAWLCHRTQKVVVDGEESPLSQVTSGVPQGTVLGPLMFLLFINDIVDNVSSEIRLFADDCVLYQEVKSPEDQRRLQQDLDRLIEWTRIWQMEFNPAKCQTLHISRRRNKLLHEYQMLGHTLQQVSQATYLGVEISDNLSWDAHINKVTGKANRSLGFIKRNLYACSKGVKESAYKTLVRPHLEYASSVWDPHLKKHINQIEKVQRSGARFVAGDYSWQTSVTQLMVGLQWQALEYRRAVHRLCILYNILNGNSPVIVPPYITQQQRELRSASCVYIQPQAHTNIYRCSFFPRTIADWKRLPPDLTDATTPPAFKAGAERYFGTY